MEVLKGKNLIRKSIFNSGNQWNASSEIFLLTYLKARTPNELTPRPFLSASPHRTSTCETKFWVWPTYCQAFQPFVGWRAYRRYIPALLKKLDKSIIVSVFITLFLRALLWKHKSEWISSYTKTETWISESINDVEIEESLCAEVNRYVITSQNEEAKNTNKALELLRRRQSPLDAQSKSFVVSFLIKAKQVHTSSTPILLIRVNRNSAKRSADPLLILFQSRQTRCPYLQYGNSSLVLPIYHGRSQRQMDNYIQEVVRLVKCTN